jgi:hypothetical protein
VAGQSHANSDSSTIPTGPSHFTQDIHQIFADDPDPLFLEESWTLGVPAAVENLHHRRHHRADRERQSRAFRELDSMAALNFIPAAPTGMESFLADRSAAIASLYDASWPQRTAAQTRPEPALYNETCDGTMTVPRARQLLEVSPESTREQVRSAYRRLVSRWHPDRLQLCTEEIRQYATLRMGEINEAYRLLRTTLQQHAA